MATRKISAAPFAFAGILVGALVPLLFTIAIFADANWTFDVNSLSDLGISSTKFAADLFNYTCMCAGILIALFAVGKFLIRCGADKASAVFLLLGGLFLIGVGIFTKDSCYHNYITWLYFITVVIAMIISGINDWKHGRTLTTAITVISFTVIVGSIPGFTIAGAEVITVMAMCFWMLGQALSLAFSKD